VTTDIEDSTMQHIVVGVDGSSASRRALVWAVAQARTSGATLQVVHAWTAPDMGRDPLAQALANKEELEAQARHELDLVVADADEGGLREPIGRTLVNGDAAQALLDAAKTADLLVVGSRGLGAGGDAALGSVSHGVIGDAPCPVVVVPPDRT
jgi:nucleotide-binding universal stress UspA family protein